MEGGAGEPSLASAAMHCRKGPPLLLLLLLLLRLRAMKEDPTWPREKRYRAASSDEVDAHMQTGWGLVLSPLLSAYRWATGELLFL